MVARLINIGFGNVVNSQKIVAVVSPDAAPVKRMVHQVIDRCNPGQENQSSDHYQ